jgi:hypothetical protein
MGENYLSDKELLCRFFLKTQKQKNTLSNSKIGKEIELIIKLIHL